jgi:cytochrome oxidase assembly protein ShyY1
MAITMTPDAPAWRRALVWSAATGLIALTAGLSHWQWGRAQTKLEQVAAAQARAQAAAWTNRQWPCAASTSAGPSGSTGSSAATGLTGSAPTAELLPRFQPARLQGQWLSAQTVWLDNRPMDGGSGFIVVTPLKLSEPAACKDQVVLVERGWVPRDPAQREHLPALPAEPGEVTVSGHLEPVVSQAYALGQEPDPAQAWPTTPTIRQNADHAFWQRWLAQAAQEAQGQASSWQVSPGVLRQHEPAAPGLLRHWPVGWQGTSPDRHRAYAAQWAALCLLTVGLNVWFLVVRPRRPSEDVHDHKLHA